MFANICTMPIKRADHAEGRRAVADRAIDFLALVEMGEEVVAVALEIVADEVVVVAVGDEPDALGQERVLDLDLFEPDRPLLARDLGQPRDLVDQFALGDAAHGEGEFRPERQAVEDRGERKADQGGGERAAENDDRRVRVEEHAQIAAHQDERDQHDRSRNQAEAGCDIHEHDPVPIRERAPADPRRRRE